MLANAYSEDPKQAAKAIAYANKVIALTAKRHEPTRQKLSAGVAHSTLGYAYLKQDKLAAAVAELKTAVSHAAGAIRKPSRRHCSAWATPMPNRIASADSIAALQKAAAIDGPYQAPAKEMLAKVSASSEEVRLRVAYFFTSASESRCALVARL